MFDPQRGGRRQSRLETLSQAAEILRNIESFWLQQLGFGAPPVSGRWPPQRETAA